jgi:serine/threonine protein kinase
VNAQAHRLLDGRVYAIKKIHFRVSQRYLSALFERRTASILRFSRNSSPLLSGFVVFFFSSTRKLEKVVREVQALASLDHVNVCRYYNAVRRLSSRQHAIATSDSPAGSLQWIEPIQAHDLEEMLRKAENSYEASEESTLRYARLML